MFATKHSFLQEIFADVKKLPCIQATLMGDSPSNVCVGGGRRSNLADFSLPYCLHFCEKG